MGIKIKNLRVSPYSQKDDIKVIFGDELKLSFEIAHVDGESYLCALDNERILYPVNRPVCAYTEVFTRDGDDVNFTLKLNTSKLRDYVSSIRKPMPVYLQIVRVVGGKYETVLLDDILAIPSVIDGSMTVYEGDPLRNLIDGKMDIPEQEGTAGQVLTLDEDGNWTWQDPQGGGDENVQSDWDCSDSESAAYILNKPELATVATSGSYNDLTDKPTIVGQEQANWDESDSSDVSFIKNKPTLFSGSYNDLTDKPDLKTVATTGSYTDLTDKPVIPEQAQADWDESDSSAVDFIKHKPALATVATSGSYNDLSNKPVIVAPVNADWDESSSEELSYILNKPQLATVATSGSYNDLSNKPTIPTQYDWLCLTAKEANSTVRLDKVGEPPAIDLEYSTDGATWYTYTWDSTTGATITLANNGKVYFRGENDTWGNSITNVYTFVMTGSFEATGNIASLYSKTCSKTTINVASSLFKNCTALTKADIFYGLRGVCNGLDQFFRGCTGLMSVEIPNINPTSRFSWGNMFTDCTNLSRIKVGFHSWVADKVAWVSGVAATGRFICPSDLDCSTRSVYYVPAGWTVERTSAPQADWDESDSTAPAFIQNKPTIPEQQQADWDESDSSAIDFIKNKPVIEDPSTGLDAMILMLTAEVGELSNKNYFHVTGTADSSAVTFNGGTYSQKYEFSFDRRNWQSQAVPFTTGLKKGEVLWIRCDGEYNGWDFVNTPIVTAIGGISVGGDMLSLASKSMNQEAVFTQGARRYHYLFANCTALTAIEEGFKFIENGFDGMMQYVFYNCTALTALPNGFSIPTATTSFSDTFYNCPIATIGNNVSICPSANNYGNLNKSNVTSIGTNFQFMTAYTTSEASGEAVFPNATIGAGWSIYQYTDAQ